MSYNRLEGGCPGVGDWFQGLGFPVVCVGEDGGTEGVSSEAPFL